jgi:hypothetical protein
VITDVLPDDDEPIGIPVDANGDPVRQGSLMVERQSYERVIDGLRIAAEACMHLVACQQTTAGRDKLKGLALRLDQCRRLCMVESGLDDPVKASPTAEVRGRPMSFAISHSRLAYGLQQAAGGARQLATCHRGDLTWSKIAERLEALVRVLRRPAPRVNSGLLLPAGFLRH